MSAHTTSPPGVTNRNWPTKGWSVLIAIAHCDPTAPASSGWSTLPQPNPSASAESEMRVIEQNAGFT